MVGAWCGVLREQLGILDLFFYETINTQRLLAYILTPIFYSLCSLQQGSEQLTDLTILCAEIFALMDYYAAYGDNYLPTFRDNLSIPSSNVKKSKKSVSSSRAKKSFLYLLTLEEGTDRLSRNVGKEIPPYAK